MADGQRHKRRKPAAIDVHVGDRLRQRRALLGLNQTALGEAVGLTYQQVQKYELGKDRIGAGRLYQFCNVLDVPVDYFFEGLPETSEAAAQFEKEPVSAKHDPMTRRETVDLVRAFYRIKDPEVRAGVEALVMSLGRS